MSGAISTRVRALLATARVANVPSVVSNVWLGAVVGSLVVIPGDGEKVIGAVGWGFWWLVAAGMCLYVAGNFLNDWYDREWDRVHRPERALPSGMFCPSTYLAIATGLVMMAGVCAWAVNEVALVVAGGILVFVVVYTLLHKRTGWGVVWVGLCRALLVVLGVTGRAGSDWNSSVYLSGVAVVVSIPLFCYIIGLSMSARFEAMRHLPEWVRRLSLVMLAMPVVAFATIFGVNVACSCHNWKPAFAAGLVPYVAWIIVCFQWRKDISRYVSGLLAGIPLVDLMFLAAIAVYAGSQVGEAVPVAVYLVPAVAFVAGLVLQRVAPAS